MFKAVMSKKFQNFELVKMDEFKKNIVITIFVSGKWFFKVDGFFTIFSFIEFMKAYTKFNIITSFKN